MVDMLTRI
jgi:NADH:ubiquinone oxidoreductase subunit F (NADH-binding)